MDIRELILAVGALEQALLQAGVPRNMVAEKLLPLRELIEEMVKRDGGRDRPKDDDGDDPLPPITSDQLQAIKRAITDGKVDERKLDRFLFGAFAEEELEELSAEEADRLISVIRRGVLAPDTGTPPPPPPPPPPPDEQHFLRLIGAIPSEPFLVRFGGPEELAGTTARSVARDHTSESSAVLMEAIVDPADVAGGIVPLSKVTPAADAPHERKDLQVTISASSADRGVHTAVLGHGQNVLLDNIWVTAFIYPFPRAGSQSTYEVQLLFIGADAAYHTDVRVDMAGELYSPCVEDEEDGAMIVDGGLEWVMGTGQGTIRRMLIDAQKPIPEWLKDRYRRCEMHAVPLGPATYHAGGWGPSCAPLPRFDEEAVGMDMIQELQELGTDRALTIETAVLEGKAIADFKYAGLGPWQPQGSKTGGGTGGDKIHPYAAIGQTPGEIRAAWWSLRTTLERSFSVDYVALGGFPISKPDYFRPYEKEIASYRQHDLMHAQRAALDAIVCLWTMGSEVAREWLLELPGRYGNPSTFPESFAGLGHKYAHRGLGWQMAIYGTAYAVSEGEHRETLLAGCTKLRDEAHAVAMPTGVTHRSTSATEGGPWAAWINPDKHKLGQLPPGTTVASTIMIPIVAEGAAVLAWSVFGPEDQKLQHLIVKAALSCWWLEENDSPRSRIIVGPIYGEPYPECKLASGDPDHSPWEPLWHLDLAARMELDPKFLERAANIMGYDGTNLDGLGEYEYSEHTGSQRAWWYRSAGVVALSQHIAAAKKKEPA